MKHLQLFEQYVEIPQSKIERYTEVASDTTKGAPIHFETETTDFKSAQGDTEGNYIVSFKNASGEDTTIEIAGASDPEFTGDAMISKIEMIPGSSSDGKEYSVVGYYEELEGTLGAYDLKKVLIEEI